MMNDDNEPTLQYSDSTSKHRKSSSSSSSSRWETRSNYGIFIIVATCLVLSIQCLNIVRLSNYLTFVLGWKEARVVPMDPTINKNAVESSIQSISISPSQYYIPPLKEQLLAAANMQQNIPQRELTFLHIPKTGGSSIVSASIPYNLTWGDCLFQASSLIFECSVYAKTHRPCPQQSWLGCRKHSPISWLFAETQFQCNPYGGKDVFAVVRHPYDRTLSEYYYFCSARRNQKHCERDKLHNVDYMNGWLQQRFRILQECLEDDNTTSNNQMNKMKCFMKHCFHEVPQYDFIFDTDTNIPNVHGQQRPAVQWVLRNENLSEEFATLMKWYDLSVTLPKERINQGKATTDRLTIANFTDDTIQLINDFYHKDFETFGYEKKVLNKN